MAGRARVALSARVPSGSPARHRPGIAGPAATVGRSRPIGGRPCPTPTGAREPRPPLLISRSFALIWVAQTLSAFGEYVLAATVTVWLATGLAPGDPALPLYIGAVIGATSLPRLVRAPIAGVLVDRWPAHRVMVAADLVRAALVQVVVPADRRAAAAGRSLLASTGVGILSAMTGPAVYATLGPEPALVMDAVSFLASAGLVLAVRERGAVAAGMDPSVASARARFRGELAAGIRIVRASPRLRVLVAGLVFAVFLVSQGPILQAEAPVGAMGRVSSLTSTVLAASSLLATVVTAQALALIPADAQPVGYPVAIAAAAVVMGGAGLGLVASGLSRGRGPAAAAS